MLGFHQKQIDTRPIPQLNQEDAMNTQFQPRALSFQCRIVNNDPLRSRVYLGEKPLRLRDFQKHGQRSALERITTEIMRIPPNLIIPFAMHMDTYEVDFQLTFQQKPEFMEDIVRVDVLLFTNKGWREPEERAISEKLRVDLAIFAWTMMTPDEHFDQGTRCSPGERCCIICGEIHRGKLIGYNNLPPIKPNYDWPIHCANPGCISHEIEKIIDPGYVFVPRAQEKSPMEEAFCRVYAGPQRPLPADVVRELLSGSDEMREDIKNEPRNETEG